MPHIVVAGATGGIGRALIQQLLERPDTIVTGLCRRPDAAADWANQYGDALSLLPWDALDPTPELALKEDVDGVIYAAGRLHGEGIRPEKRLEDLDAGALASAFQVNASAFVLLVQALLPRLRHKRLKRIVAVSAKVGSIGDNGFGGWYGYRASKAALNMLTRNLSIELPRRIRPVTCVAVHPGTTRTQLSEPFQQSLAQLQVHEPHDTATNLLSIYDSLDTEHNGQFFSWDGSSLPW